MLVGSGGREHALAWRLVQEDPTVEIIAAPGNPGISVLAECVPVPATDVDGLLTLARVRGVTWTLVGPEAPLAAGIVDTFTAAGMPVFGPTRAAAMLETSKEFSKTLMNEAGIPTAKAIVCRSPGDARRAIDALSVPVVVKTSGLAAGKGVIVCNTVDEANDAAASMLEGKAFGDAGTTILVEEFMTGEELSLFAITDGQHAVVLPPAQDHKRLLDGDKGPNTGGMGAYCPVSLVDRHAALVDDVLERIVHPTLSAMRVRGTPFKGLLYVGLMITTSGPKVVEFNCRFGDPETQAVLPALDPNARIGELMATVARGDALRGDGLLRTTCSAVTTVLAVPGYPDAPRSGAQITLPPATDDVLVFHAGTKRSADGSLVTAGGRVLAVTGVGNSPEAAQRASIAAAGAITFIGKQFRTDIGSRELARRAGTS
ncbi:MAG: phosphoribosylamine--glycine ligase [Gemmatimonadaceae bacterium]